jgi:Zn-dependent protease
MIFSDVEIQHLTGGLVVIAALPVMISTGIEEDLGFTVCVMGIFIAAFLCHELAHKVSAQMFGYWAEFRLNTWGVALTLVSYFSPVKLVAPGAVLIDGQLYWNDVGKIAMAGPLTNIGQALLFLVVQTLTGNAVLTDLAYIGCSLNSSLALINLLPYGMLVGAKVLQWNWKVWLIFAAIAGTLFLFCSS